MSSLLASPGHTAALSRLGHALADPTRTGVLLALRTAPATPSELAEQLGVSRQVMSNQLRCLRGCGLVTAQTSGRQSWYSLSDERLADALDALLGLTLRLEPGCCDTQECTC